MASSNRVRRVVTRARFAFLAAAGLAALLPAGAHGAAGDILSPTGWIQGGDSTREHPVNAGRPTEVLTTAGGKSYVVGGTAGDDPANPFLAQGRATVARLGPDGHSDLTFSEDGAADFALSPEGHGAIDAALLGDGDLLLLTKDGRVARMNDDGTLDASFGTAGVITVPVSPFFDGPAPENEDRSVEWGDIVVHEEGFVIAGGATRINPAGWDWSIAMARYTLSGTPDSDFGTGGYSTPAPGRPDFRIWPGDVAVDNSTPARILLAGAETFNTPERWWLQRIDADGVLDPTFGDGGTVYIDVLADGKMFSSPRALLPLGSGDIVVGGYAASDAAVHGFTTAAVARVDDAGDLVTTFGTGGVLEVSAENLSEFTDLALADDGKILGAGPAYVGHTNESTGSTFVTVHHGVARLTATGLDTSFSANGVAVGPADWSGEATAIARRGDGVAVTVGSYGRWTKLFWDLLPVRTPVATAAPLLNGSGTIGTSLTASNGGWSYSPTEFAHRWERCNTADADPMTAPEPTGCVVIAGQTTSSLTLTNADAGKHVRTIVSASNAAGTADQASATVTVPVIPPTVDTPPEIEEFDVRVGDTVHATRGVYTSSATLSYTSAWQRCDATNPTADQCSFATLPQDDSAAARTYTTVPADEGKYLRVIVTATSSDGDVTGVSTTRYIDLASDGGAVAPVNDVPPAITPTGSVQEGATLAKSTDGNWSQGGLTFAYRWQRCDTGGGAPANCDPIDSATGTTYVTRAADAGKHLRLRVSATNADNLTGHGFSPTTAITARPADTGGGGTGGGGTGGGGTGGSTGGGGTGGGAPPTTPANPNAPVTIDTTTTRPMPDVRGLTIEAARTKIADAGIFVTVDHDYILRAKAPKHNGATLDFGDVFSQSVAPGTQIESGLATPRKVKLAIFGGPPAPPTPPREIAKDPCLTRDFRADLGRMNLDDLRELLEAKRCKRLDFDFVVSKTATELEVRKAEREGKRLEITVTVPENPAHLDLTIGLLPGKRHKSQPTFGLDDWALTQGMKNNFGLEVLNRAGERVIGARVLIDGEKVGENDIYDSTGADGIAYVDGWNPDKAGTVNVLVEQRDAGDGRVLGFGRFKVANRKKLGFTGVDGYSYTDTTWRKDKGKASAAAGPKARSSVLNFADLFGLLNAWEAIVSFFKPGDDSDAEKLATAYGKGYRHVQLLVGGLVANANSNVISTGGGNVIATGGGNVISTGGGNVIATGGGNAVSLAKAGVIATGGGNFTGEGSVRSGQGEIRTVPVQLRDAAGTVIATGGGNWISTNSGTVIATGGGNVISTGGGNVISTGGGN